MNQHLQNIIDILQRIDHLSDEEKSIILKLLKDANKELDITAFKLDRTEKVKRTTAILLEETIEELEQKEKPLKSQKMPFKINGRIKSNPATTHPIRKNGFAWRTYRRHCA
jgi:Na+/phosphate symporter